MGSAFANIASGLRTVKNTEVTFNFSCNTKFGEKVALIGSMPLLGHWDPQRAVELKTSPASFPVWSVKIDLPRDKIVEYKYVILQEARGVRSRVVWENLPPGINRVVNTHGKKEVALTEALGSLESVEEYVEVTRGKKFMSSSDLDSVKNEDLEHVHVPKKLEKRKLAINEAEELRGGYQDSDSLVRFLRSSCRRPTTSSRSW